MVKNVFFTYLLTYLLTYLFTYFIPKMSNYPVK